MFANAEFKNGDIVVQVLDPTEQGMITGILVSINEAIEYRIAWGKGGISFHFAQELKAVATTNDDLIELYP